MAVKQTVGRDSLGGIRITGIDEMFRISGSIQVEQFEPAEVLQSRRNTHAKL